MSIAYMPRGHDGHDSSPNRRIERMLSPGESRWKISKREIIFLLINLASFFGALQSSAAVAADASDYASYPKPPAPVVNWTGFYVGAHAGIGWMLNGVADVSTAAFNNSGASSGTIHARNSTVGALAGYNQQVGNAVVGIEGDFTWFRPSGIATAANTLPNGAPAASGGVSWMSGMKWLSSVVPRIGYLVTPSVLVFGTGGPAIGEIEGSALHAFVRGCPNCAIAAPFQSITFGMEGSGGIEFQFAQNWMLRTEYRYYRLEGHSAAESYQGPGPLFGTQVGVAGWGNFTIQSARVALSYKF
jgi:outer membrane immunogenic protein